MGRNGLPFPGLAAACHPVGGGELVQSRVFSEVRQSSPMRTEGGRYTGELKVFSEENRKIGAAQERQREASKATVIRRS